MKNKIKDLREQRRKALAEARKINDQAAAENRALTGDENETYSNAMAEYRSIADDIAREEELQQEESRMNELADRQADQNSEGGASERRDGDSPEDREMRAFEHFLMTGDVGEYRALQVDINTSGGHLVTPQQMVNRLIKNIDDAVVLRGLATTHQVKTAKSLGAPSLDSDPVDPDWTTELQTGNTDDAMSFGKRILHPHPVATKLLVSKELMRVMPNVEALVRDRLAYKMGVKHENAFMNGDGNLKPLGLFTASDNGIPTSRDVSTGNTSTALTFDGLKRAKGNLKRAYRKRPSSRWLFHPDTMTEIALLKDGSQRYMLQDNVTAGEPDVLLGIKVEESEWCPSTMTASQYVGMVADFSWYWIADAMDISIEIMKEIYSGTNQNGFHVRSNTDGMPVLAEAFSRVQLASG